MRYDHYSGVRRQRVRTRLMMMLVYGFSFLFSTLATTLHFSTPFWRSVVPSLQGSNKMIHKKRARQRFFYFIVPTNTQYTCKEIYCAFVLCVNKYNVHLLDKCNIIYKMQGTYQPRVTVLYFVQPRFKGCRNIRQKGFQASRRKVHEKRVLLDCYPAHSSNSLPTFRENLSVQSSRIKK